MRIDLAPEAVADCIDRAGFGFMFAPAGLVRGPRKLKIVRTASSLRTGTT